MGMETNMSAWTETLDENASDAECQLAEACKHCGKPHRAHYRNGAGAWIDCRVPSAPTYVSYTDRLGAAISRLGLRLAWGVYRADRKTEAEAYARLNRLCADFARDVSGRHNAGFSLDQGSALAVVWMRANSSGHVTTYHRTYFCCVDEESEPEVYTLRQVDA